MKKHLIAAAVAAAVAVPAMAQVTVYGTVDLSYGRYSNIGTEAAGAGNQTAVQSGMLTTNRLGFRGEEDLGGGLKAGFVLETGMPFDSEGARNFADRGGELYLAGGFGQVRIGKSATSDANTVCSGPTNLTNFPAISCGTGTRPDNRVQYISPTISGITANVAYATDANDDENLLEVGKDDGRYSNVGLNYAAGPLRVLVFQASLDIESATQDGKRKDTGLLASYNFGPFTGQVRYVASKTSGTVTTAVDTKTTALDFSIPLGNGINAGLGYVTVDADGDDVDSKRYTAFVTKDLSKRTNIYAAYARTNQDDAAAAYTTTGGLAAGAGRDQNIYGIGVRHSF